MEKPHRQGLNCQSEAFLSIKKLFFDFNLLRDIAKGSDQAFAPINLGRYRMDVVDLDVLTGVDNGDVTC